MSTNYNDVAARIAPLQTDEQARLAVLHSYAIMDSGAEQVFDDLIALARTILDVPMAYIAMIDSDRQWFKASHGLNIPGTPRDISFCHHTIQKEEVLAVIDTHKDPRFWNNPLVTGPPHIRFYAGAPIISPEGYAVGTLCLSDTKPHDDFQHGAALMALARQAAALLELRKSLGVQQEAIRLAADQRDRLWDNSLDMMLIARPDGSLVAGNPAWEKMFGDVPSDGSASLINFLGPDEARSPTPMINGQKDVQVERQMRASDGSIMYTSWTLAREDDMIFGIARDITRAREAETQLVHAQRMESVGQLTGGIAHDFNNLLTIILGNLEMAERKLKTGQTDKAKMAIANAQDGAERAASLTQRLLAFARRQPLSPTRISLSQLIENLIPLAKQALGERCRLSVRCEDDLPSLHIDSSQLENGILNLVVNARDAMGEQGDVALVATHKILDTKSAKAEGPDARPGHYVRLCVSDNGSGIPPEIAEKIFEPFFTTKEAGRGTGLGLSQVHGFVRQSGGFMTMKTALGEGTTLSLWLPVEKDGDHNIADHSEENDSNSNIALCAPSPDITIMLVEDEEGVRTHVETLISEQGYNVIAYPSAADAAKALEAEPQAPDLVLSDVMMPDMDGYDLANWMKQHFPDVPVILMTGYTGGEVPATSPHSALITKPFSSDDLLALISKILSATLQDG
ncbi:ATP-binding protein [Parasphingorhabdus sp. DH2-15]|uniref:ATP-binding protein n=1 Tax=Parasphingorhabdus sp. DH2-15 TaxID=3444112 RepID=UPI003F687F7E